MSESMFSNILGGILEEHADLARAAQKTQQAASPESGLLDIDLPFMDPSPTNHE